MSERESSSDRVTFLSVLKKNPIILSLFWPPDCVIPPKNIPKLRWKRKKKKRKVSTNRRRTLHPQRTFNSTWLHMIAYINRSFVLRMYYYLPPVYHLPTPTKQYLKLLSLSLLFRFKCGSETVSCVRRQHNNMLCILLSSHVCINVRIWSLFDPSCREKLVKLIGTRQGYELPTKSWLVQNDWLF